VESERGLQLDARCRGRSGRHLGVRVAGAEGRSIVDVEIDDSLFNPTFRFDDGATLLIDADTDLDPWVLRAEGLSAVLVGYGPEGHSPFRG
jgi:hypothetical protein